MNNKISELATLSDVSFGDYFPIVDVSEGVTKKVEKGVFLSNVGKSELIGSGSTFGESVSIQFSKILNQFENIVGLYVSAKCSTNNLTCGTFIPAIMLDKQTNIMIEAFNSDNQHIKCVTIPYNNGVSKFDINLVNNKNEEFVFEVHVIYVK